MLTETDKNITVFYHTEKKKQNITDFVIFQLFSGFRTGNLLGYNNDYGNWGNGCVYKQL